MDPLSEQQEAFCRAFVEIPVAARAAREAGYAPASARRQGYRLLQAPAVQARIRVLREAMAEVHAVGRADIAAKAEALFRRAMEDHQYHAAGRALALQAALAGLASGNRAADVTAVAQAMGDTADAPCGTGGGAAVPAGDGGKVRALPARAPDSPPPVAPGAAVLRNKPVLRNKVAGAG